MLAFHVTVEPAAEPVSLSEAKLHLRVDANTEDARVAQIIKAARRRVEEETGRALIAQTLVYRLDAFPRADTIRLPRPRLRTVTSVAYLDEAGDSQTVDSDAYVVDGVAEPGRIALKDGETWPTTLRQAGAVTVTYTAGWDDAAAVPEPLKEAMLLLIADSFDVRRPTVIGTIVARNDDAYRALLAPYRVRYW